MPCVVPIHWRPRAGLTCRRSSTRRQLACAPWQHRQQCCGCIKPRWRAWPSRLSRAASLWRCAVARGVALLGGTPSMQRRFLLPQVPHPLPEMSHAERGCMRRPGCFPCHDSGPRQAFFCCHGRCRAACRCGAENSDHVPAPAAQKRRIRVANSALPCRTPGCATSVREAAPT